MYIGPLPVFAYVGIALSLLTIVQVLIGRRMLKVNFKYHRVNGYVIVVGGLIHGASGLAFLLLPR